MNGPDFWIVINSPTSRATNSFLRRRLSNYSQWHPLSPGSYAPKENTRPEGSETAAFARRRMWPTISASRIPTYSRSIASVAPPVLGSPYVRFDHHKRSNKSRSSCPIEVPVSASHRRFEYDHDGIVSQWLEWRQPCCLWPTPQECRPLLTPR